MGRFSAHDWIGQVDVPTAVVVTTRDEMVPPSRQRKLAQSIPTAEVYEVEMDWLREDGAWRIDARQGEGACAACGTRVPGVFEAEPGRRGARRSPVHVAA